MNITYVDTFTLYVCLFGLVIVSLITGYVFGETYTIKNFKRKINKDIQDKFIEHYFKAMNVEPSDKYLDEIVLIVLDDNTTINYKINDIKKVIRMYLKESIGDDV